LAQGLLFVISDVPQSIDEEFNAWYDTEHIAERLAVDGFLSAQRLISTGRPSRYLARYELRDADVLSLPAYLAVSANANSPWTKRILTRIRIDRMVGVRVGADEDLLTPTPRLLALRFSGLEGDGPARLEKMWREFFSTDAGIVQSRVFALPTDNGPGALLLVSGHGDLERALIPQLAGTLLDRLDLLETFVPL
jgi:hypothetical protein